RDQRPSPPPKPSSKNAARTTANAPQTRPPTTSCPAGSSATAAAPPTSATWHTDTPVHQPARHAHRRDHRQPSRAAPRRPHRDPRPHPPHPRTSPQNKRGRPATQGDPTTTHQRDQNLRQEQ